MSALHCRRFYAHTLEGQPPAKWQALDEHLTSVASLAAAHASAFDTEEWGRLTGLWHDLGKYSDAFQSHLSVSHDPHEGEVGGRVDHSTAGGRHAVDEFRVVGHLLAFPIVGHHSGLLDSMGQGACMQGPLVRT
jgi:CRISPR-associated endonuclease/helicase Cas3